jgi:hypothetical protein
MARPQQSTTFTVPNSTPGVTSPGSTKGSRDAKPFVIVPEGMVIPEDKLEPHWRDAIDAATD